MFVKKSGSEKGFTIIEVLIVLAIAGLILLIVFLAVPALQRNSRNTQYRSEASNLLGAYSEISNNKNGAVLTSSEQAAVLSAANTKNITTLKIQPYAASGADVTVATGAPTTNQIDTGTAIIRTGAKCAAADSGTSTKGTQRQIAIYFAIEQSSGTPTIQCQES